MLGQIKAADTWPLEERKSFGTLHRIWHGSEDAWSGRLL